MKAKIVNKSGLLKRITFLKKKKKKIVLCHGVFDLFHIGHIRHIKFAKSHGDILVISITKDRFINKGNGKPVFNENLRAELISTIEYVDYVYISESETAIDVINLIKPDVYCKGNEYKNIKNDLTKKIQLEINAVKKNKGITVFSEDITFSSSKLLNKNFNVFTKTQSKFLEKIKKRIPFENIKDIFSEISKLKVLVIGEILIDEYVFSEAVGKSGKEPILILREIKKERYIGGTGAIVKNISNFVNQKISLISYIGQRKESLGEINNFLGKKVNSFLLCKKNSSTIVKRRYVDSISNSKLFGIYNFDYNNLIKKEETFLLNSIKKQINKHDVIILADYGHGLFSKKISNFLSKSEKFITLNAQLNASNIGYHSLRNYSNLMCIVINERELRHETRDRVSDIKKLILEISRVRKFKYILITRGGDGLILYSTKNKSFYECPAFATNIVDKVGSGDVILAVFSLCLKCNIDMDVALFISSIAAAHKIKNFANKEFILPDQLIKIFYHILK